MTLITQGVKLSIFQVQFKVCPPARIPEPGAASSHLMERLPDVGSVLLS